MADKPKIQVRFYRFQNRLKEKAGGAGAQGTGSIPEDVLAQATEALEKMAEDYPDWVARLLTELYEEHRRCVDTPDQRRAFFKAIRDVAHDMRGQGGTFGYDLISDFSDSLYDFAGRSTGMTDNHVEIIKAHIDAMNAVIKGRVRGDGGDVGRALKKGLEEAIAKYEP